MSSNETRIPLAEAKNIATGVIEKLSPHCERIEIAGSIRRCKETVGDIEIVCIPKTEMGGLFGDEQEVSRGFLRAVIEWPATKGSAEGRYTRRVLPGGVTLDLFIANPDNWGLIFAIRTGSATYSHMVLAAGWVRRGFHSKDGMLHRRGEPVPTPEEENLFRKAGVRWIEPQFRTP